MIVTCPRCFTDYDVTVSRRLPDKMLEYMCSGSHDGAGEHVWLGSVTDATQSFDAEDGVTDELLDPLLGCVHAGEPFVEYGVVEYRLRLAHPDLFVAHVRDRGHVMLGPRKGQATASSVRFATALSRLSRSGELLTVYGPGTGAWRHDERISYWARPPQPTGAHLTWVAFCATLGRSSEWTDEDRAPFDEGPTT